MGILIFLSGNIIYSAIFMSISNNSYLSFQDRVSDRQTKCHILMWFWNTMKYDEFKKLNSRRHHISMVITNISFRWLRNRTWSIYSDMLVVCWELRSYSWWLYEFANVSMAFVDRHQYMYMHIKAYWVKLSCLHMGHFTIYMTYQWWLSYKIVYAYIGHHSTIVV